MTRKKDSVALFEVIAKDKDKYPKAGVSVPGWMGGAPQGPVAPSGPAASEPSAPTVAQAPPAAMAAAPEAPPAASDEPMLSIVAGRLRLSLNYTVALVAAFGLIVVLFGAVALGRWTARGGKAAGDSGGNLAGIVDSGKANDGAEQAPAKKAEGRQKPLEARGPGKTEGPPVVPAARISGKYYLVIQMLPGGTTTELHKEAWKIRDFCVANGKPADVQEVSKNYMVWSLTPFDTPSPKDPKVQQYAQEIEDLGKKYVAQKGRYNLMQRRSVGAPLDPLMLLYTTEKK